MRLNIGWYKILLNNVLKTENLNEIKKSLIRVTSTKQ